MDMPPLITELKTPKVLWYQNGISVLTNSECMHLLIGSIVHASLATHDYDKSRSFQTHCASVDCFSTQHDGNNYYLWLNLYGTVIPEQTINQDKGREILIKLAKAHKWMDWLRLHRERTSIPMIRHDLEHGITEDRPIIKDDFPPIGSIYAAYKEKYITINPDVPSTDEDESDDETMGWHF